MRRRHRCTATLAIALTALLAGRSPPAWPQAGPMPALFGIRIGEPLDGQMPPCPAGTTTRTDGPAACLLPGNGTYRSVALPRSLVQELSLLLDLRTVRVVDGLVVEVEAEFPPRDVSRVERYLVRTYGKPTESERYERHGRLSGLRSYISHAWRGEAVTIVFSENASSGNGSVRAFSNRWATRN